MNNRLQTKVRNSIKIFTRRLKAHIYVCLAKTRPRLWHGGANKRPQADCRTMAPQCKASAGRDKRSRRARNILTYSSRLPNQPQTISSFCSTFLSATWQRTQKKKILQKLSKGFGCGVQLEANLKSANATKSNTFNLARVRFFGVCFLMWQWLVCCSNWVTGTVRAQMDDLFNGHHLLIILFVRRAEK